MPGSDIYFRSSTPHEFRAHSDWACSLDLLQVEDDRAQINAVINQLDEKKRLALEETWKQVKALHTRAECTTLQVLWQRLINILQ